MEGIRQQIRNLNIPYPQRHLLELEVTGDLESSEPDGRRPQERALPPEVVEELEELHNTLIYRFLGRWGKARRTVESSAAFLPLFLAFFLIMEDETMVNFIREGGIGMYVILAIGGYLLGREFLNVIRLVLIKDHSVRNLRVDTPSVLLGCLALMLAGLGGTVMGLYVSADAVTAAQSSYEQLILGVKESITHLVLSSFLCMFIVLAHYGIRRVMQIWHMPVTGLE